jgi:hypothetical protein
MQTNSERNYNFAGIESTLDIIPKLDPFDMDAKDEVIAELSSALTKVMDLARRGYLFNERATSFLAAKGETDMLRFCVDELSSPVHEDAYNRAAERGHLKCMDILQSFKHDPLEALYRAVEAGELATVTRIMGPCTFAPDMQRLDISQEKGGFPEVKAYLTSILGDF